MTGPLCLPRLVVLGQHMSCAGPDGGKSAGVSSKSVPHHRPPAGHFCIVCVRACVCAKDVCAHGVGLPACPRHVPTQTPNTSQRPSERSRLPHCVRGAASRNHRTTQIPPHVMLWKCSCRATGPTVCPLTAEWQASCLGEVGRWTEPQHFFSLNQGHLNCLLSL